MIRCIEAGGLEAWRLAAWMVILQPAAWRLGGVGSLDAGGNGSLGVLGAWMLVARMDFCDFRSISVRSGGESFPACGGIGV